MTGFVAGPRLGTGLAPRRHAVWFPAQKLTLLTNGIQPPSSGYARGGKARLDSGTGAMGEGDTRHRPERERIYQFYQFYQINYFCTIPNLC